MRNQKKTKKNSVKLGKPPPETRRQWESNGASSGELPITNNSVEKLGNTCNRFLETRSIEGKLVQPDFYRVVTGFSLINGHTHTHGNVSVNWQVISWDAGGSWVDHSHGIADRFIATTTTTTTKTTKKRKKTKKKKAKRNFPPSLLPSFQPLSTLWMAPSPCLTWFYLVLPSFLHQPSTNEVSRYILMARS